MKTSLTLFTISVLFPLFSTSLAFANDKAILASCKADLKFSDSACQCVLTKVDEKLSPAQKEMFVTMISGDNAAVSQALAEGKASGEDMLVLTNFMAETPAQCENQ